MDYFRILNLNREPFSNSPEPDFFFPAAKHLSCLQQLELAIRLRRGLNVVMGDVGTGKTTLCRELILRLAESEEDRNGIQTHLLLDPSFTTAGEFLSTVAVTFGIGETDAAESEWHLKESIKNELLRKGVVEKKTVVLIIDEGQKLPEFCLELLREFLNYETNENKLLQIVIFAQNEFSDTLKVYANFTDRINLLYHLKPLSFLEMKAMIRFRMERAGQASEVQHAFTLPALWAIYRATGGYPRKIITLCHQVILTLIIQNRTKAGWSLVRSSAKRVPGFYIRPRPKKLRWAMASAAAVLFAILILIIMAPEQMNVVHSLFMVNKPEAPSVSIAALPPAEKPAVPSIPPPERVKPVEKAAVKMPAMLGDVKVQNRDTVFRVFNRIYDNVKLSDRMIQEIKKQNPHIANLNYVRPGDVVHIPALPIALKTPAGKAKVLVQIARCGSLDEAYSVLMNHPDGLPHARILSWWTPREGKVFIVALKDEFADEASAQKAIHQMPSSIAAGAGLIKKWDKDTVFFAYR